MVGIYIGQGIDFNPRTHRGVRPLSQWTKEDIIEISIHAPIVGCDPASIGFKVLINAISIHAPIVGCDYLRF